MNAQLQHDIIEAAREFWIEWNYDAEHLYSYLNSDCWLDDEDENNNNYKSIIDEKVETLMTNGAICEDDDDEDDDSWMDGIKAAIAYMLTNNFATREQLIEHIKAF